MAWEWLEARMLMAQSITLGPIVLTDNGQFNVTNGHLYSANSSYVDIALRPTAMEPLHELVRVNLDGPSGGLLTFDTQDPTLFKLAGGGLSVEADGNTSPSPIWQAPDSTTEVPFDLSQLVDGTGVLLDEKSALPIVVSRATFTVDSILLHQPQGMDSSAGQVELQGGVTLPAFQNWDLSRFKVRVDGANYVIIDRSGTTLTGVRAGGSSEGFQVAGLEIQGTFNLEYSHTATDTIFSIAFGVTISTQAQGDAGKKVFDGVGGSIQATVDNGKLTALGFGIQGKFSVAGLSVSADTGNPVTFDYNFDQQQWEIGGGLTVAFNGNSIDTIVQTASGTPGLIIQGGVVTRFDARVVASFSLFGASIQTTGAGLTFVYDTARDLFELSGGLKVILPTSGGQTTFIAATLFNADNTPGLVIQDGKLKSLHLALDGQFNLFGLTLNVSQAGIRYDAPASGAPDSSTLDLFGQVSVMAYGVTASASLGSESSPGLLIKDGTPVLDNFGFMLSNVNLGAFVIQNLAVAYQHTGAGLLGYSVYVGLMLQFPGAGGWGVGGSVRIVNGGLDAISLSYDEGTSPTGIPLGDTGLFISHIDASVSNIENPSNIVVMGDIDVVFGDEIRILGQQAAIFRVHGGFTVDKDELIINADVEFGAYRKSDGTYGNILGGGSGTVDLDWATGVYKVDANVLLVDGIFDLSVDFTFATGRDIRFVAIGTVEIPPAVPFIGGDKLGGIGVYFEYAYPHDGTGGSTTFAAWVSLDIIWKFDVGFEFLYDGTNDSRQFKFIGTGTVNALLNPPMQVSTDTYDYSSTFDGTIPANATGETLGVTYPAPAPGVTIVGTPTVMIKRKSDGKLFTEAQFAAATNGLSLVTQAPIATSDGKVVQVIGSATNRFQAINDQYTEILQVQATGGNPFPDATKLQFTGAYHVATPTVDAPALPSVLVDGSGVTVTGQVDSAQLASGSVSVYRVQDADPTRTPVLIGRSAFSPAGGSSTSWTATVPLDVRNTFPVSYHLFAVVNDGAGAPVTSANSPSFEPAIAVAGSVANQLGQPLTGWTVFLDYNNNGVRDPGEPATITNNNGEYTFPPSPPGYNPVPVDRGFHAVLVNLDPNHYQIPQSADPVYYGGVNTAEAPFTVRQATAVQGTVFTDAAQNGSPAGQAPLAGRTVFDDVNGNGTFDPGEPSAVTNAQGYYSIAGLSPGTQTIDVVLQPGESLSVASGSTTVVIQPGGFDLHILNLGVYNYVTISGTVTQHQRAAGGGLDPTPTPAPGVTVSLDDIYGNSVATTQTDASGNYTFKATQDDYFVVRETPASGTRQVQPAFTRILSSSLPNFIIDSSLNLPSVFYVQADFLGDGRIETALASQDDHGVTSAGITTTVGGYPVVPVQYPFDPFDVVGLEFPGDSHFITLTDRGTGLPDLAILARITANGYGPEVLYIGKNLGHFQFSFTYLTIPAGEHASDIRAGNIYGDGVDSIVLEMTTAAGAHGLDVLRVDESGQAMGGGTFLATASGPSESAGAFAVGDLYGTGRDVIVQAISGGGAATTTLAIASAAPNSGLSATYVPIAGSTAYDGGIAIGDVNGDGLPDVALATGSGVGRVLFLLQTPGNRGFAPSPSILTTGYTSGIQQLALQDLNLDGLNDLIASGKSAAAYQVEIFAGKDSGPNFAAAFPLPSTSATPDFSIVRTPGNPTPEILVTYSTPFDVHVYGYPVYSEQFGGVYEFNATRGQTYPGLDFVNDPIFSITGTVYLDANRDGLRDPSESHLAGVTLFLDLNGNGQPDVGEPVATSGADGLFSFPALPDGTYRVGILAGGNRVATGPLGAFRTVVVSGGVALPVDFGVADRQVVPSGIVQGVVGTSLSFQAVAVPGTRATYSIVGNVPAGAKINRQTGRFTWTPNQPGTYTITIRRVGAGRNARTTTETITLVVVPRALGIGKFGIKRSSSPRTGGFLEVVSAQLQSLGAKAGRMAVIDWGDGTPPTLLPAPGSIQASHLYARRGSYVVTLLLITRDGGTNTSSFGFSTPGASAAGSATGLSALADDPNRPVAPSTGGLPSPTFPAPRVATTNPSTPDLTAAATTTTTAAATPKPSTPEPPRPQVRIGAGAAARSSRVAVTATDRVPRPVTSGLLGVA